MIINYKGGYPDLNRELTVPHTVVLTIELYPPDFYVKLLFILKYYLIYTIILPYLYYNITLFIL